MLRRLIASTLATAAWVLMLSTASADMLPPRGTLTTYHIATNELTFEWDQDSPYDIIIQPGQTQPSVSVIIHEIPNPTGGFVGAIYEMVVPNFYDPLPVKFIDIQFTGGNPQAGALDLPFVLDIIGADSQYGTAAPSVPVIGDLLNRIPTPTLVTESWIMFPNPDFEVIKFYAPVGFDLLSVRIQTQSIPEPASLMVLAPGAMRLIRRRR